MKNTTLVFNMRLFMYFFVRICGTSILYLGLSYDFENSETQN